MLTLTLDGQPVDLPADAAVALSYRSSDLRRLDTREASFSETFALPLTARNARVLGTPHALSSQTGSPYRRLPAVLRANGLPVLRGVAVLEASELGYEVTLFDDTADLFGRVGDAALRSLDLRAYDHPRTFAAIQAASTDDPTRGYVYALADTGRLAAAGTGDVVLATEQPASVYESAILTAIVARALPGFALAGSLLVDPLFRRAVLPAAASVPLLREAYLSPYRVQVATLADKTYAVPAGGSQRNALDLEFPAVVTGDAANFAAAIAYAPPGHYAQVEVRGVLRILSDGFPKYVTLHPAGLPQANAFIQRVAIVGRPPADRLTPFAVPFSFTVPAYLFAASGALSLRVADADNGSTVSGSDPYIYLTLLAGSNVTWAVAPPALAGAPVHLETTLPDISQGDYLKLLANRFNAGFVVDAAARTVRFDLFNDLEPHRTQAVEWSTKLDYAQRPRLDYRLASYAQRNAFRYKDAPPAYAPAFGSLSPVAADAQIGLAALLVPDATLPLTAVAYAAPVVLPVDRAVWAGRAVVAWLPSAPPIDPNDPRYAVVYTPGGNYRGGDRVTWLGRTWTSNRSVFGVAAVPGAYGVMPAGGTAAAPPNDWNADAPAENVPAVAAVVALGTAAPAVRDEPTGGATYAPTLGLSRAGLSFAELLPAYHEGTARILSRVQLLTAYFSLSAADIAQLDFSVPIALNIPWVAGYGALRGSFYLNLVDQFRPGTPGPVRVELLRLGDPIAGLAAAAQPLPARPTRLLLTEAGPPLLTETPVYLTQEPA